MKEYKCEICGVKIAPKGIHGKPKYCQEHAKIKRREAKQAADLAAKERKKVARETDALNKRDKLSQFLRELDAYNVQRRERGECPISYGKYAAMVGRMD